MNGIENLVPDLELCKQIPEGAFADSALVWSYSCDKRKTEPFVEERDCIDFCRMGMVNAPPVYPAPTLAEIMGALPKNVEYQFFNGKFLPCHPKFDEDDFADEKPEDAALKLWLELNKSDLSDKSDQSDTDRKGGGK